jgi:UDP-2,3-diacylglucosamine pyrophosphatase LpxH
VTSGPRRFRALFLSDVHLGTRGCQAQRLLDFLRLHDAETIYLVGDIVDGWQLRGGWYWPQAHNDVVQKLLRKARKGSRVIYVPGNHDEFLRDYYGTHFGGIEIVETAIHVGADGRRYLVIHGDHFDMIVKHARWLALLGDHAYRLALVANTLFNAVRRGHAARPGAAAHDRAAHRRAAAGRDPHRHRRADRLSGAELLRCQPASVHHQLPHPVSRLCVGAGADIGSASV